jgi:hypothetical protein
MTLEVYLDGGQSNMSKRADKLIGELRALESVQQRIDCVARDFLKNKNKYSVIDTWTLGNLLGLDFRHNGAWYHTFWAIKPKLEDEDFTYPFAENVGLLKVKLTARRYKQLVTLAEDIIAKGLRRDLPLTKEEKALLRNAYADSQEVGCGDLILAQTTLTSSDGVELDFEVCVGDGGEAFDPQSPYDLKKGKGFNSDEYIQIN